MSCRVRNDQRQHLSTHRVVQRLSGYLLKTFPPVLSSGVWQATGPSGITFPHICLSVPVLLFVQTCFVNYYLSFCITFPHMGLQTSRSQLGRRPPTNKSESRLPESTDCDYCYLQFTSDNTIYMIYIYICI